MPSTRSNRAVSFGSPWGQTTTTSNPASLSVRHSGHTRLSRGTDRFSTRISTRGFRACIASTITASFHALRPSTGWFSRRRDRSNCHRRATTASLASSSMLGHRAERIDVPFLDLGCVHAGLKTQILDDIGALLDSGAFTNGPAVGEFERAFAAYCGRRDCVGVANGTDAIRLALVGAGIAPGDEVIVPANTFVATFESICQAGGVPVPVDVTEADYNLDVAEAESSLSHRTA